VIKREKKEENEILLRKRFQIQRSMEDLPIKYQEKNEWWQIKKFKLSRKGNFFCSPSFSS
jgi:hypothetical protein